MSTSARPWKELQRLDPSVNSIDGLAYWPPLGLLRRGDPPEHGWVHTPHTASTEIWHEMTLSPVSGRGAACERAQ